MLHIDDSAVSKPKLCYSFQNFRKCSASTQDVCEILAALGPSLIRWIETVSCRKQQKEITPVDDPELQAWLSEKSLPQQRVGQLLHLAYCR